MCSGLRESVQLGGCVRVGVKVYSSCVCWGVRESVQLWVGEYGCVVKGMC